MPGEDPPSHTSYSAPALVGSAERIMIDDESDHRHLGKGLREQELLGNSGLAQRSHLQKVPYKKIPEKARYKTKEITNISKIY